MIKAARRPIYPKSEGKSSLQGLYTLKNKGSLLASGFINNLQYTWNLSIAQKVENEYKYNIVEKVSLDYSNLRYRKKKFSWKQITERFFGEPKIIILWHNI